MPKLPQPGAILPHRPPFLFVDEVVDVGEKSIIARGTFSGEEDFFAGHFPGQPIVPGVLLIEAMAQTFACLVMDGEKLEGVYLTGVDRARFRAPVRPPATVEFHVEVTGQKLGLVTARAEARVDGKKVADAKLTGYGAREGEVPA